MNKLIFIFFAPFLLLLASCRTTKNIETSAITEANQRCVTTSHEDKLLSVTIEYPSFDTSIPQQNNTDTKSSGNTTEPSKPATNLKRHILKIGNTTIPILPNTKISISKSSSKTKIDSVHNNNKAKDDKSIKPKEDNSELRQYGTILVFFILFYCLVVSLRKKTP